MSKYYEWLTSEQSWYEYLNKDMVMSTSTETCKHEFQYILNGPKGFCKLCDINGKINTETGEIVWVNFNG